MDEIVKDERFKHIVNDSRFRIMPKNERKFKVDKRFKNMFQDKKFKLKYTVDKRGRPINSTTNDNLKKFYQISSSESEDETKDEQENDKKKSIEKQKVEKPETESEEKEEEEEEESESEQEAEEKSETKSSSESESESEEEDEESEVEESVEPIPWNELDKDTIREDKTTHRLALCNMDWDRIKAIDLYVLLNSFKPSQGFINSVKIYISDYGKKRLDYERLHGPQELTEKSSGYDSSNDLTDSDSDEDKNDDDDEEGKNFNRRKLRIYQFNRLRYYYAIVECDTAETADKIYTECDGMEYESSSTRIDLRFVPDDTEFDDSLIKDSCTEAPDPITYKPNLFVTTALNQTKVECTWDETPKDRLAITMKKYTEDDLKNSDFKNILATSSEEEEDEAEEESKDTQDSSQEESKNENDKDDEETRIKKYRELLLGAESKSKKQRDCDLEFSWEGGMEEEGFNELLFNSKPKDKNKKFSKKNSKPELTEEEKKEQARLALLTMDNEDQKEHFNLDDLLLDKKGKKKVKKSKNYDVDDNEQKREDNFEMNLEDPRFQAIFSDHRFNIDPSNQLFKKTKAMENVLNEKIKRIQSNDSKQNHEEVSDDLKKGDSGVSLLVKSIKSKTECLKRKKEDNKFQINKKLNIK